MSTVSQLPHTHPKNIANLEVSKHVVQKAISDITKRLVVFNFREDTGPIWFMNSCTVHVCFKVNTVQLHIMEKRLMWETYDT